MLYYRIMEFIPKTIAIPIVVGLVAQLSKLIVEAIRKGAIELRLLNTYGGMPSSHTALVVSITTVVGLSEGVASGAFAVAAILAFITIRDAIGFRMYLGEHARILNRLIEELPAPEKPKFPAHILERIGHTPYEAFIGGLIGLSLTLLMWVILP